MSEPQRVIVTDVQIKFWSMVMLLVKSALASIPALVILVIVAAGTISLLGSLSRVRESIFSATSSTYPPPASSNVSLFATTTTKSGLQYAVLMTGSGRMPTASDIVTVHYRGTLVDGTEFDSSYKRGQPAVFPVNKVIPGWTEALQLMHEGDKWKLTIPPHLAYGDRGAGKLIPPDATLVFEVELLKVN